MKILPIPDKTEVTAERAIPLDMADENGNMPPAQILRGPLESRVVKGWDYVNYYVNGIPVLIDTVKAVAPLTERNYVRDKIGRFASTKGGGGGDSGDTGGSDSAGGGGGGGGGTDATAKAEELAFRTSNEDGADAAAAPGAHDAVKAAGYDPNGEVAWRADELGSNWNYDSTNEFSQDLMIAAAERQGKPAASWVSTRSDREAAFNPTAGMRYSDSNAANETYADRNLAAHALLDGNRKLIDKNFGPNDTVTVYRGTKQHWDPGSTKASMKNSLSSWTTSQYEAERFGIGYNSVIKTTVRRDQMAGLPAFGLGNGTHSEIVLYGGDLDIEVLP